MADPREPEDEIDGIEDEADEGTDAGQIDDQSGDDAQGDGQENEVVQAEERVDRRSRRDDQLRDEIRAAREHAQRVENELNQLRQERQQRQQESQGETEAQFEARVSLLDQDDRTKARLDRADRMHRALLQAQTLSLADRMDKSNYDAIAKSDPIYRKYAADVEQLVLIERNKGHDINRETALDFLRGRNARLKSQKAAPVQPQRRAPVQQTRTTGGRGDQPREERRERRYAANDMSPEAVKQRLFRDDAFI